MIPHDGTVARRCARGKRQRFIGAAVLRGAAGLLAKRDVTGDGQNEDSSLCHYKRQPDIVVKLFHNHFLPPKLHQINHDCIIPRRLCSIKKKTGGSFVTLFE